MIWCECTTYKYSCIRSNTSDNYCVHYIYVYNYYGFIDNYFICMHRFQQGAISKLQNKLKCSLGIWHYHDSSGIHDVPWTLVIMFQEHACPLLMDQTHFCFYLASFWNWAMNMWAWHIETYGTTRIYNTWVQDAWCARYVCRTSKS